MQQYKNPMLKIVGVAFALLVITLIFIEVPFVKDIKNSIPGLENLGKKSEEPGHDEKENGGPEHEDHGEKFVSISPEEMAEFNIKLRTAGPGILITYISLPGEIMVNADRLAHVVPRVSGVVREVHNNLGDVVQPGDIMAVLESSELGEAKAEIFQRKKQLELSEIDLARIKMIHDNTQILLQLLKVPSNFNTSSNNADIVLLKTLPEIETVLNKTEGLDMGENRKLLISTYSQFLLTHETYKREKNLFKKKISSQSDFLLAESDLKKAQASFMATYDEVAFSIKRQLLEKSRAVEVAKTSLQASERHLHILGISEQMIQNLEDDKEQGVEIARVGVQAPIKGTVIEKHITLGEMLEKDATVYLLADLSSVWVDLSVYQKDMALIRNGMEVIISVGKGIPDVKGKISYVRSLVGEETRTALARVVIPNPQGLWRPGLFVTGKLIVEEITVPIAVPKSAIQNIEGQAVVFVNTEEGLFPQPVKTGKSSETHTEIISGITPGQQFVSEGGFTLKAQLSKSDFASDDDD